MNAKDLVKKATDTAKDMNIFRSVKSRLSDRYKEVQKLGRAVTKKYNIGNKPEHITTPPKIHMSNLEAYMRGGVGFISYDVYRLVTEEDIEEDKKKVEEDAALYKTKLALGLFHERYDLRNQVLGEKYLNSRCEPEVVKTITERIEMNKPIKREEIER